MKSKIKKLVIRVVFGTPIKGEAIPEPTFTTIIPEGYGQNNFNVWSYKTLLH